VLAARLGRVLCGQGPDAGDDLGGAAVQDVQRLGADPVFHRRVAGGVEAPGGLPQVFQHVDEVDHDGQGDPPRRGGGLDQAELVVVPVDQGDPGPAVIRVAAVGLAEDLADGHIPARGDVAGIPAVLRPRRLLLPGDRIRVRAHDLLRGPRFRPDVEDAAGLGHPLAALLLPGPGPLLERAHPLLRGFGTAAPRLRAHRHALAIGGDHQRRQDRLLLPVLIPGAPWLTRIRSWQNRSASAAAATVICSSCRLPTLTPVAASTNSCAC
jgi:hypothetical protein